VSPFGLGRYAVSNAEFTTFADATGWVTEAERWGWSLVFVGLRAPGSPTTPAVNAAPWWRRVEGADWRHPKGPDSTLAGRADHPVVHVSWTTPPPPAAGREDDSRPRPSGSTPPGAGWPGAVSRGATISNPEVSTG
jgi:hypothetical protein